MSRDTESSAIVNENSRPVVKVVVLARDSFRFLILRCTVGPPDTSGWPTPASREVEQPGPGGGCQVGDPVANPAAPPPDAARLLADSGLGLHLGSGKVRGKRDCQHARAYGTYRAKVHLDRRVDTLDHES